MNSVSLVLGKWHKRCKSGMAMRVLYERNLEYNDKVYVCYVDYEKALEHVNWTKLVTILQT